MNPTPETSIQPAETNSTTAAAEGVPTTHEPTAPGTKCTANQLLADAPRTELGNAERFAVRHGADVRHVGPWSKWLAWDGRRYKVDDSGEVKRRMTKTVRCIHQEALMLATKMKEEHHQWAERSESARSLRASLSLAESMEGIAAPVDAFDADPWLLNVRNGTIDLRTGELRPHDRKDLVTKLCDVEYDPAAECGQWLATLQLFFAEDEALIAYWRRLIGYCLTGVIREHVLPIAYGTGSNGKSTILGTIVDMLGKDYALNAPHGFLSVKTGEVHPTGRASLHGKRLVVAIEADESRRLDAALVKSLTGGDPLTVRRMREDFWEFDPTHKMLLAVNHRPVIRETDHGIWRRVALVPFNVTLPDSDAKLDMKDVLAEEFPGILAWAVRGCLDWQEKGLAAPACVLDETAAYRKDQDVIGQFLDECTQAERTTSAGADGTLATDLFNAFQGWAKGRNEFVMTSNAFGRKLTDQRIHKHPSRSGAVYSLYLSSEGERCRFQTTSSRYN